MFSLQNLCVIQSNYQKKKKKKKKQKIFQSDVDWVSVFGSFSN